MTTTPQRRRPCPAPGTRGTHTASSPQAPAPVALGSRGPAGARAPGTAPGRRVSCRRTRARWTWSRSRTTDPRGGDWTLVPWHFERCHFDCFLKGILHFYGFYHLGTASLFGSELSQGTVLPGRPRGGLAPSETPAVAPHGAQARDPSPSADPPPCPGPCSAEQADCSVAQGSGGPGRSWCDFNKNVCFARVASAWLSSPGVTWAGAAGLGHGPPPHGPPQSVCRTLTRELRGRGGVCDHEGSVRNLWRAFPSSPDTSGGHPQSGRHLGGCRSEVGSGGERWLLDRLPEARPLRPSVPAGPVGPARTVPVVPEATPVPQGEIPQSHSAWSAVYCRATVASVASHSRQRIKGAGGWAGVHGRRRAAPWGPLGGRGDRGRQSLRGPVLEPRSAPAAGSWGLSCVAGAPGLCRRTTDGK